jgi:hypothetical protein
MFLKCPYSVKVSEVVFNLGSILSCMYGFDGSRVWGFMQGDPTTCRFILAEDQYVGTYGRRNRGGVMPDCWSVDGVDGAVDLDEPKQEVEEVKVGVDSLANKLCEVRVHVQKLKITAICVALGCGCVTMAICGVASGLVMSRMW